MVTPAKPGSYYGRPVLKVTRWKAPHLPGYLFLGGLSGASSAMGAMAAVTGHRKLARASRITSAIAAAGGSGLLVAELGRPERFLNMLRVVKPTSPMSMGSWLLAAHGSLCGAAAFSAVTGRLPRTGAAASAASAATGPLLATYTGVLIANTAVPAWHEAYRLLPVLFGASALASAGALGMITVPCGEAAPARRMAVLGAAAEIATAAALEQGAGMRESPGLVSRPYRSGRAGSLLRTARWLTGAGAAGAMLSGRSRPLAVASGLLLTGGALCTRFGIFSAGVASAEDPDYVTGQQTG